MKKFMLVAAAVVILAGCVGGPGWPGGPAGQILPGPTETSVEYSRSTRTVSRDHYVPRVRSLWDYNILWDSTPLTAQRVYGKVGTTLWNNDESAFLSSGDAFVRIGAANARMENSFYGSAPSYRGGRWNFGPSGYDPWTQDFNGGMGCLIGGGANATLYRQGPFQVNTGWSINYWETNDNFTFRYPAGPPLDGPILWQEAQVRIVENDISLGCSWEITTDGMGTLVPYGGITAGFINGDADVRFNLNNEFYDRTSYGFRENAPVGCYVGTRWEVPVLKDKLWFFGGVQGNFWGDGCGLDVNGGVFF